MRGLVVAGVEGPPAILEVGLEPGAEVHRRGRRVTPMSPEVAGGVAGRDVQGAAEGDRQVLEVAADADPLGEDVERGAGRARVRVAEGHLRVDPVADRPAPAPSRAAHRRTARPRSATADRPRRTGWPSGSAAFPAAVRRPALRGRSRLTGSGSPESSIERRVREPNRALRRHEPGVRCCRRDRGIPPTARPARGAPGRARAGRGGRDG